MKASDKRYAAINAWMNDMCPESNGYYPRTEIVEEITPGLIEMRDLGRTERWQATIDRVIKMVEENAGSNHLDWAIKQGAIFLGHAAE